MKTTDKNFYEEIKGQAEPMLRKLAEGKSAKDVAAEIYMTLPGKTEEIARLMADRVIQVVGKYHDSLEKCMDMDDGAEFIGDSVRKSVKDVADPEERCRIYYRNLIALTAYGIRIEDGEGAEENAEKYVRENEKFPYENEDFAVLEEKLLNLNIEAILNTDLVAAQLPAILNSLKDENADQAMAVFNFGRQSADLKAVLSMQAYVNSINDMYEDIGSDADIESVTMRTCAAVDTYAAIAQNEAGEISETMLERIFKWIGYVLGAFIAGFLIYKGAVYFYRFFLGFAPFSPELNNIFAITATGGILLAVFDSNLVSIAQERFGDAAKYILHGASVTVEKFIKGVNRIWKFMNKHFGRQIARLRALRDRIISLGKKEPEQEIAEPEELREPEPIAEEEEEQDRLKFDPIADGLYV